MTVQRCCVQRNWKGARLSLSRRNIMLRDRFCCQYVSSAPSSSLCSSPVLLSVSAGWRCQCCSRQFRSRNLEEDAATVSRSRSKAR